MIKIKIATLKAAQRCFHLLQLLGVSITATSAAIAADASAKTETSTLLQWTNAIDMRAAFLTSVLSVVILFAIGKTDFKSPFGIWGGRFIIFVLVVLNIALWATQV
jgi:hypothetical protein